MGLFSSIFGAIGVNKGTDRAAEGLTTGYNALKQGLADTEKRIEPIAKYSPQIIDQLYASIANGDMSKFYDSPDYQYARDEAQRGIQANAASQGVLMSGRTLKELEKNASGLASGNYQNYLQNLGGLYNQVNPYYQQYSQIPYLQGQDQAQFSNTLGQLYGNAQMSKYNSIGAGLDWGVDALLSLASGGAYQGSGNSGASTGLSLGNIFGGDSQMSGWGTPLSNTGYVNNIANANTPAFEQLLRSLQPQLTYG